ncbi:MAG: B12-binding domain-containing radical SAM protein [Flavobacteriales bacterium]|nr:B12-binding domain-containing radical SAM protein [Flavobacteriales bacterium]
MSRVLVTHGYFYRLDPKQWRDARPYPPLGTLLMAAVLREDGHDVSVHDTGLSTGPESLIPVLDAAQPAVVVIHDDGFNYLTKMCLSVMRESTLTMVAVAKERGALVLVNSSDSTDHPELYLQAGADAVVLGEGELTTREILQLHRNGSSITGVPGIAFKGAQGLERSAPRPINTDLDAFPMPAWDLIDVDPYRRIWMRSQGRFSLNVATTRGCPFKCNWCAKPIYGNRYNSRSPEHVVRELAYLNERFRPDHIWMCDDIFGLKPGWVQEFGRLLNERKLRIPFKIQSRADLLLKTDTIQALVEAGLEEVWIGAESGSQKVLDAMDKGITVEQIAQARARLAEHGVRVCFFLQFGYPGEDEEDVQATIAMVDRLMPDDIGISVSYPLPGTVFHERVKASMAHASNWTDSDDLALLFEQGQRPAYYKRLHRYVHRRFRRKQAQRSLLGKASFAERPRRLLEFLYHGAQEQVHLTRTSRYPDA